MIKIRESLFGISSNNASNASPSSTRYEQTAFSTLLKTTRWWSLDPGSTRRSASWSKVADCSREPAWVAILAWESSNTTRTAGSTSSGSRASKRASPWFTNS